MLRSTNPFDVVIGGAGIAATAVALRLCNIGFRPLLLGTPARIFPGIEAVPAVVCQLFEELGMQQILRQIGATVVEGFENNWYLGAPVLHLGQWIHVERRRLAEAALREALRRGASLRICGSLPKLSILSDSVSIVHGGTQLRFEAAIDATGRSAVWSRPIRRLGSQLADIFEATGNICSRARVVRLPGSWAYQIGVGRSTTVAILHKDRTRQTPDASTCEALGIASEHLRYVGRRPAFPQWSENPIQGRRLAVGDAALALDPVAGQGIRFALSSAFAASAVLNTWKNFPGECDATGFFRRFVAQCRERHLRFLDVLQRPSPPVKSRASSLPNSVLFCGQTTRSELQVGARIILDEGILLQDGTSVRWLGEFDLLRIRDLAQRPVRSSDLLHRLGSEDRILSQAAALLHWCLQHEILKPTV
jgi:flavin-dependent dehydrogenase